MRVFLFILCYCALPVFSQTVLDWNTNNIGVSTFVPNNSSGASVTISGTGFNALQGASPRYNTGYLGYANWSMNGLGLGADFANTSSSIIVDINFTSPPCGDLTFNVHDLDGSTSGNIFEDKIIIDTWDQNNSPIAINASNFIFGASGFCGGALYYGGNNALNTQIGRCQNGAYNANSYGSVGSAVQVTLKSPTTKIKRIRITYTSAKGASPDVNAYFTGTNPSYENIVIGNISLIPASITPPSVSGPGPICAGTSSTLSASGSFSTYTWNTGQTGASLSVSPNASTIYSVTGTNSSGCTSSSSITVNTRALPDATASVDDAIICRNQQITLSSGPNTNTSTLSYDFESSNPFTFVNDGGTIAWRYGTFAKCNGTRGIYVGTATTNNNYATFQTSVDFAYIDVPITECNATLSFNWKCAGKLTDNLSVWIVPVTTTLVGGTQLVNGGNIIKLSGDYWNGAVSCNAVNSLNLIQGWVTKGQTIRLVFQAKNASALSMTNTAPMIDDVVIVQSSSYNYAWTSSVTSFTSLLQNPTNTPLSSTTFSVTVTDCSGCVKTANVPVSIDPCPLPVELVSFDGACKELERTLSWETASEHNNDYFSIEQSENGVDFSLLEKIVAVGNSTMFTNYKYEITNTRGGDYFRLSQTDLDGQVEVFNTVYLACDTYTNTFSISPNPAKEILEIRASTTTDEAVGLVFTALDGRVIYKLPIAKNVDVSTFETGVYNVYLVDVNGNLYSEPKRFVKY
jgi:hypothetical protein